MIKTKRCILRNFIDQDSTIIHRYKNDLRCSRYQRYKDTTMKGIQKYIEVHKNDILFSYQYHQCYAIALHDNQIIGDITIFINPMDQCVTLGCSIDYEYQRMGFAYEVLVEVVGKLQINYPKYEMVTLVLKENIASRALVEKLGYQYHKYSEKMESIIYVIEAKQS